MITRAMTNKDPKGENTSGGGHLGGTHTRPIPRRQDHLHHIQEGRQGAPERRQELSVIDR